MSEIELRKYCLEKAIEILSWRKDFFSKRDLTPITLADIIYTYLTKGEIKEFKLPGSKK